MAGAGKKTFIAGEVLTAAQVNDFLMDQAVMRFSGSAARAASITVPTEGMVTYLDDSNRVEIYDGSGWVPSGVGVYSASTDRNDQIVSPTAGLVTYLSSTDRIEYYNGSSWVATDGIERLGPGTDGQVLAWQSASYGWQSIAAGARTVTASAANTYYKIVADTTAGTIVGTGNASATASVLFYDSASALAGSFATVAGVGNVTLSTTSPYFYLISTASGPISLETVSTLSGTTGSLTAASVTGTWSGPPGQYFYAVIGGGAGGAPTQPNGGGGGGGSGSINRGASIFTSPISVTIGAGGGSGANGGTTTFGSISASGGVAASSRNGANGGSGGGGGGQRSPSISYSGGAGGTNGANGAGGIPFGGTGGTGSGVPIAGIVSPVGAVYFGGPGGRCYGSIGGTPSAGITAASTSFGAGGGGGRSYSPAVLAPGGSGAPGVVYLLGAF